jgi:hypothetical protein
MNQARTQRSQMTFIISIPILCSSKLLVPVPPRLRSLPAALVTINLLLLGDVLLQDNTHLRNKLGSDLPVLQRIDRSSNRNLTWRWIISLSLPISRSSFAFDTLKRLISLRRPLS